MTYEQLADGVGVTMRANEVFRFACCDCGLVHDVVVATQSHKPFGLAVQRNRKATRARRRALKVKLVRRPK